MSFDKQAFAEANGCTGVPHRFVVYDEDGVAQDISGTFVDEFYEDVSAEIAQRVFDRVPEIAKTCGHPRFFVLDKHGAVVREIEVG